MDQGEIGSVDARGFQIYHVEPRGLDPETNRVESLRPLWVVEPGVVLERRLVAGHDHSHANTLPQVNGAFRVEGEWPSPITFTRGWSRATARPWNNEASDGFIRLERGRADFLRVVTEKVAETCGGGVFSPAMFGGATRIWVRAGYEEVRRLQVMERPLGVEIQRPRREVNTAEPPPWQRLLEIDKAAFEGFWRMSIHGLEEASHSTTFSVVLTATDADHICGYAIVGSQWGTAYLQRIAVDPVVEGKGIGTDLVRAAVAWARSTPATTMVLNVRSSNTRAIALYQRCGFTATGASLRILRHGDTTLLGE